MTEIPEVDNAQANLRSYQDLLNAHPLYVLFAWS